MSAQLKEQLGNLKLVPDSKQTTKKRKEKEEKEKEKNGIPPIAKPRIGSCLVCSKTATWPASDGFVCGRAHNEEWEKAMGFDLFAVDHTIPRK